MNKRTLILLILLSSLGLFVLFDDVFYKELIKLYVKVNSYNSIDKASFSKESKLRFKALPYHERAANYLDAGKYDEAIPEANKAIEIYPRYARAYTNLAIAYYQKGLCNQAIKEVRKALKINPNLFEALNTLGIILHETGQLDKAIKIHKKAIKVNPKDGRVHKNLALDYLDKGLFNMAEKEFDQVRSLKGADTSVLKDNGWNKRIEVFQERIKQDSYDARANYLLGEIYYQIGLYDLSITSFQKSIEVGSQYKGNDYNTVAAYNNLGASYIQKRMFNEAISNYKKAITINYKSYVSYYGLGVAYWRTGNYREAIKSCQQILQNTTDYFFVMQYIMGACYEQMRDYPRAVKEYEGIFKTLSSSKMSNIPGCAFLGLTRCYIKMGVKDKALKELNNFQNYFSHLDERRNPYGFLGLFSFMDPVTVQIDGKTYRGKEKIRMEYKNKFVEFYEIKGIKNEDDRRARAEELFSAGNMYLAISLNDEAIKLLQESRYFGYYYAAKANFSMGIAYLQKGLLNKAVDEFYKAIRMDYWYGNFFDEIYSYLFLKE